MLDNITTTFENTDRDAYIRQRYQEIAQDPIVQKVTKRVYFLPFWAAGGSLLSIMTVNYSHKRVNMVTPTWKFWLWGSVGALIGFQLGIWNVKNYYDKLDPSRRIIREVKELQTMAYSPSISVKAKGNSDSGEPPFELFAEEKGDKKNEKGRML
jgi:hypothetical protein